MSNMQRVKGRGFEYNIRDLFRKYFNWLKRKPERMLGSGAFEGLKGDINFWGEIDVAVECKNHAKGLKKIYNFWEQTKAEAQDNRLPVLFIKTTRQEPLMVMDAEDGIKMLEYYYRPTGAIVKPKKLKDKIKIDDSELPFSKKKQLNIN